MEPINIKILVTGIIIVLSFIGQSVVKKHIAKYADKKGFSVHRKVYVSNFFGFLMSMLIVIGLIITWEVSFQGIAVYLASIFTLLGVAFVAAWSMLSNITASLILFFAYPFKIGDYVRIQDGGENSVEGTIINITLFNIRILTEDDIEVSYPNNLALQKPIKRYRKKAIKPKDMEEDDLNRFD
ncbi:mechanosensitive ion channel family protein [Flammeovirga kamogawensis]|uniref:Mechanosensitive ion channel family protein n=1 Tax=Flammeovirga kamogawensis TaxID=373891 RepID=A0ABX8H1U2_9BACT|nr:mechanosensitive ion channel family protein [Flammeovirga kamogawensis]MBB6464050.1 small-conductance mechanosensitive channel [Flammeovirga kamogawensis]QWG09864.1 mechanosensitive ion channel family protein [Flammeovirga kamogawensis]TRX65371.1 mechanosensitive ion channel family protein [Flammeovirga kamogawensis]